MPLSKKGSYHANPATAAMHDNAQPATQPDPGEQSSSGAAFEIHSPNHPETGDGSNFHTRVHHPEGVEEQKHASFEDAAEHVGQNEAEPSDDAGEADDVSGSDVDDEY